MGDIFDLQRFVDAQNPLYGRVLSELAAGQKRSHWMWFVFPQIAGLGTSATAQHFALSGIEETNAYHTHRILGPRLLECTNLVMAIEDRTIHRIFGSPDDMKFRSSMTLFSHAATDDRIFDQALTKYFDGVGDPLTIGLLSRS